MVIRPYYHDDDDDDDDDNDDDDDDDDHQVGQGPPQQVVCTIPTGEEPVDIRKLWTGHCYHDDVGEIDYSEDFDKVDDDKVDDDDDDDDGDAPSFSNIGIAIV